MLSSAGMSATSIGTVRHKPVMARQKPVQRGTIHMLMHKRIPAAVGAAVTATALAATGVAVTGVAASAAVTRPTHPVSPAHTALPKIFVAMNGKKISLNRSTYASGGAEVVSTVTHEPQGDPTFIRLDPGVTVAQLLKAAAGDPNNIALIASVVFSPQANKGTSSAQAYLAPGCYVAVDLATNAKVPPLTTFKVTKAASPAKLPKPKATVASIEFGFRGPGRLHDGELVRFANHGFLAHMIVAARGRNAAGAREIARLLKAGKDGKDGKAQRLATGFYSFDNVLTTAHTSSGSSITGPATGCWPASWTPRTAVSTPSSAWNASSAS